MRTEYIISVVENAEEFVDVSSVETDESILSTKLVDVDKRGVFVSDITEVASSIVEDVVESPSLIVEATVEFDDVDSSLENVSGLVRVSNVLG
jgi:hypothetical protein